MSKTEQIIKLLESVEPKVKLEDLPKMERIKEIYRELGKIPNDPNHITPKGNSLYQELKELMMQISKKI